MPLITKLSFNKEARSFLIKKIIEYVIIKKGIKACTRTVIKTSKAKRSGANDSWNLLAKVVQKMMATTKSYIVTSANVLCVIIHRIHLGTMSPICKNLIVKNKIMIIVVNQVNCVRNQIVLGWCATVSIDDL